MHLDETALPSATWDLGPVVNARGDALAVTASYGAYRDEASVLARSIDPARSTFERVGTSPHGGLVTAKGDTLWNCDRGQPESRGACSFSTDLGDSWHDAHLPH